MISDFFCPNTGGVETHIYHLSQCLIARGHKVIVLTHAYGRRRGIRYLKNGLKVYYLPFLVIYNGVVLPSVYATFPYIRWILLRERINAVHGHSSFSALAHEGMFHAQALDIHTFFTDHSLFGFADMSSILTNKLLQCSLTNCSHVVCVSYTSKENTLLRAHLTSDRVSVIPNAIDCDIFKPSNKPLDNSKITIVMVGRLVYRKGIDLLADIIPVICKRNPDVQFIIVTIVIISRLVYRKGADLLAALIPPVCKHNKEVHFLIGGDGPKRVLLEEVREKNALHERVTLLGSLPHTEVRDVLIQGQIFLNTSLTEAFCMAIVEAASCGLYVVSTNVGGVPEVLPRDLISLAAPTVSALANSLNLAVQRCRQNNLLEPSTVHERVRRMYKWSNVSERVEQVYINALQAPVDSIPVRLMKYFHCGTIFGIFFILIAALNIIVLRILELIQPAHKIEHIFENAQVPEPCRISDETKTARLK